MGRRTLYRALPDHSYDPRVTDLAYPLRPPIGKLPDGSVDLFRNKNIANTTPIQLVANAASIRVLPNNLRRTGLIVQNKDATVAGFVGFGVQADANSLSLAAGAIMLLDFTCPTSEVYLFSTANIQMVLVEMSRGA